MVSLDLHPFTLIVGLLVILIIDNVIKAMGKKNLEDIVWIIYCKIAGSLGNSKIKAINEKTIEAGKINKERKSISAQDQYAKWTKLNRQFDKVNEEIKTLTNDLASDKALITKYLTTVINILTSWPLWFSRFWYRKKVLFYLPPGLFPYPIERIFALPFTVLGGVGLTVWMFAIRNVISSVILMVSFPSEEKVEKPVKEKKEEKVQEL